MVERHAFLRGLTWLCPFEPYGADCWPPKPLGMLSEAAAGQQRRPRPLASRIILKDCTCCLTRGRDVLFFAAAAAAAGGGDAAPAAPGAEAEAAAAGEDPAQMSFSMALMEVNPRAARAALREKRRRERAEERQRRRRRRQEEEDEEEERRRRQPPPPPSLSEEPSGSASSGSSSLLLLPPPPAVRRQQQQQEEEEDEEKEEAEWGDEEEEGDLSLVVPALFFRVDGKVYLVDHTAIETIVCPRLGEEQPPPPPPAPAPQPGEQQQQEEEQPQPQALPPYAAFKFPTATLRFWLARLSLSPLNATQPLVSAIDALSRALTPRAWAPPPLDPLPAAVTGGDGGEWEVGQVEACLHAVDTLLMPPLAFGWAPGEGEGLLRLAGRAFARVGALAW